jgi:hypothetical protein
MRLVLLCALAAILLPAAGWKQLFNGKDLTGWKMTGPGKFEVEDGALKTTGGMGLLFHEGGRIGNSRIRVVFKTKGDKDNSGVVIRMPEAPSDPWYGVHNGFEVQIDGGGDEWHCTGAIYSLSKVTQRPQKAAGEWNVMEIELKGKLTRIFLNGQLVNTYRDGQAVPDRKQWYEPVRGPRPDAGFIGLQNHDPRSTVWFKEISVR